MPNKDTDTHPPAPVAGTLGSAPARPEPPGRPRMLDDADGAVQWVDHEAPAYPGGPCRAIDPEEQQRNEATFNAGLARRFFHR
ncbi:MAG: hypothetical protein ACRDVG_07755 [Jatrophihabitantaceae bacterium]